MTFNQDVRIGSNVYHVQTEVEGMEVVTTVFSQGQVLSQVRRAVPVGLLKNKAELKEFIKAQHKGVVNKIIALAKSYSVSDLSTGKQKRITVKKFKLPNELRDRIGDLLVDEFGLYTESILDEVEEKSNTAVDFVTHLLNQIENPELSDKIRNLFELHYGKEVMNAIDDTWENVDVEKLLDVLTEKYGILAKSELEKIEQRVKNGESLRDVLSLYEIDASSVLK